MSKGRGLGVHNRAGGIPYAVPSPVAAILCPVRLPSGVGRPWFGIPRGGAPVVDACRQEGGRHSPDSKKAPSNPGHLESSCSSCSCSSCSCCSCFSCCGGRSRRRRSRSTATYKSRSTSYLKAGQAILVDAHHGAFFRPFGLGFIGESARSRRDLDLA